MTADSSIIALQTVAAGFGTALIHESFARAFLERGELLSPFEYRLPIPQAYFLVARDGARERDEVEAFRSWLVGAGIAGTEGMAPL